MRVLNSDIAYTCAQVSEVGEGAFIATTNDEPALRVLVRMNSNESVQIGQTVYLHYVTSNVYPYRVAMQWRLMLYEPIASLRLIGERVAELGNRYNLTAGYTMRRRVLCAYLMNYTFIVYQPIQLTSHPLELLSMMQQHLEKVTRDYAPDDEYSAVYCFGI